MHDFQSNTVAGDEDMQRARQEADAAISRAFHALRQLMRLIRGGAHPELISDALERLDGLVLGADDALARVAGDWRRLRPAIASLVLDATEGGGA